MKAFKGGAILAAKSGGRMFHIAALSNQSIAQNMPLYMYHRATFEQQYPENTMVGIDATSRRYALELDIRKTSDQVLVLSHDTTIDRTSTGTGTISSMTYAAINAFDFGVKYAAKYAGETIPMLNAIFLKYKKTRVYLLDTKTNSDNLHTDVANLVVAHGLQDNCIIACTTWAEVDMVRAVSPTLNYGNLYIGGQTWADYTSRGCKWLFQSTGILMTPAVIADAHTNGLKVNISLVGNKLLNNKLLALGVDSIMCKNPKYLNGEAITLPVTLPFQIPIVGDYLNEYWTTDSVHEYLKYKALNGGIEQTIVSTTLDYCTYVGHKITNDNFKLTATITPKALNGVTTSNVGFHLSNCDEFPMGPNAQSTYRDVHGFAPADMVNGYHVYFRQNGGMGISKVLNGVATGVVGAGWTNCFTPMVVGTPLTVEITFTATTIAIRVNGGTIYSVNDANIVRSFFVGPVWNKTGCRFENIIFS